MNDDWIDSLWYATMREKLGGGYRYSWMPEPEKPDETEIRFTDPDRKHPDVIELVEGTDGVWRDALDEEHREQMRRLLYSMLMNPTLAMNTVIQVN